MKPTFDYNLYHLAEEFPNLSITVRLSDLTKYSMMLIHETKVALDQEIAEREAKNLEPLLTVETVMARLSISRQTLYRWNKSGVLRCVHVGGEIRYRLSDIQEMIEG